MNALLTGAQPSLNVLLIGQDRKQTDLYADLLKELADCQIDVIGYSQKAIDRFGDRFAGLNYHLVIIDAPPQVEEVDPLTVLETIRRVSPLTSVILISEHGRVEEAVAAIKMGAEDYFKKPFNIESFHLAVKRGLDKKTVFGDDLGASNYLGLINACQMISGSMEQEKIFAIVQSYLARELRANHSAIYSIRSEAAVRVDGFSEAVKMDRAMEEVLDIALQASNPLPKMLEANELFRFVDRGKLTPGLFVFRFRCVGDVDYFCVCLSPQRPSSIDFFENRIRLLKAQIEVTGRNIEQYMGIQHLAYVDDATGLYNTRYLNNILDREIAQASAAHKSFAVLFIDADRFKAVNDTYGHLIGTRLLNELGHQLKKFVRETDTVFRYGGDEFVAVLSPCDLETAKTVAERIRRSVEQRHFLAREKLNIRFTVSIGVALFPDHADSKKTVIDAADKAMYSAKKSTRNSVFITSAKDGVESDLEDGKH